MPSELLHAVAATSGGLVFVGSNSGVGAFDGETWSFPRNLAFAVADLSVTNDGKLWMATERGIAVYDGKKVRRLDQRRGLIDNELMDLAIDHLGRIWARGKGSVVLVMP
jgi:ligand-binding sensor domain-containing protein